MSTQTDNPTVTHDDLHTQYTRLAYQLKKAEEAYEEARAAEVEYNYGLDKLIEQYQADHPELVQAFNQAKQHKTDAEAAVKDTRESLKGLLALYWIDNRSDEKPIDGLGKRDSIDYAVRPGKDVLLHMQLREFFPYLLVIDEQALRQFVKNNAVVDSEGRASLPSPMGDYLSALLPINKREATISDKTLIKAAPDFDPDATTTGEENSPEAAATAEQDQYEAAIDQMLLVPDEDPWAAEHEYRSNQVPVVVSDDGDIPF